MEIISCKDLTFFYPKPDGGLSGPPVLEDINLSVSRGEFLTVLGHNGSGKSTLAKHMNAILLPSKGTVTVDGIDTRDEERLIDIRRRVGMVFQNPDNQIVATVVEEDVAFALENLGVLPEDIRRRVDEALAAVGMTEYRLHAPHQLSGGQKQRVAIAGVIAMRPDCVVLDEPTAMLDPRGRQEVMRTLHDLNENFGVTIVLITHFMDEAAGSHRVVVMRSGKILMDSSPGEVFSKVELLHEAGLDVPQAARLAWELREAGVNLPGDIITGERCADALMKLLA